MMAKLQLATAQDSAVGSQTAALALSENAAPCSGLQRSDDVSWSCEQSNQPVDNLGLVTARPQGQLWTKKIERRNVKGIIAQ